MRHQVRRYNEDELMNKQARKAAAALDWIYATYQVDREELASIAALKAIDPETDIIAMCDVFTDIAYEQQEEQDAKQHPAAVTANTVVHLKLNGQWYVVNENVMKDVLQ